MSRRTSKMPTPVASDFQTAVGSRVESVNAHDLISRGLPPPRRRSYKHASINTNNMQVRFLFGKFARRANLKASRHLNDSRATSFILESRTRIRTPLNLVFVRRK